MRLPVPASTVPTNTVVSPRPRWLGLSEALHAEWTKTRTVASTGWLLLAAIALTVAVGAAVAAATGCPPGAVCQVDPAKVSLTGIDLGQAVVAIVAVLAISNEYSTGMICITLSAMPRRTVVLAAKAAVLGGLALAAGTIAVLASVLAGRLILSGHGFTPAHGYELLSLGHGEVLRAAAGSVLYLALIALLGLGVAAAVRDSAVAIGIVLGLLYLFPIVANVVGNAHWHRHLEQIGPMSAGLAIQATTDLTSLPISPWAGLGVLAAWAAAALLAGGLVLGLRDASPAPPVTSAPASPGPRRAPWPARRAFPLVATIVMICVGMAGTIWGPVYYGEKAWAVPDDLWATLVAAQRLLHLDLAGLYTAPTNLVSFPGAAVILVPVAALMDAAGIPIQAGRQGVHPAGWLLAGPLETILSALALFAADALAERMGVSRLKRFLLAAAGATALWNVSVRWGHPEDAVAVGLLMYAALALSDERPSRAAWLAGAGVAVQPLVLLAFPILVAAVEPKRLPGFLARAATPAVALLAAAAAANWTATIHAVTNQPNAPTIDHPTPWIYLTLLAPHMSGGSVAAGPARALAVVVACGCGVVTWRRWQTARLAGAWLPDDLAALLWWIAVTLALRTVFEPVMVSYYVWPPLAVALVAASRDWLRLLPTAVTAIVLTFLAQGSWRNPWVWWTPIALVLALTLAVSKPGRSPAAQVLAEPGEQFAADSTP